MASISLRANHLLHAISKPPELLSVIGDNHRRFSFSDNSLSVIITLLLQKLPKCCAHSNTKNVPSANFKTVFTFRDAEYWKQMDQSELCISLQCTVNIFKMWLWYNACQTVEFKVESTAKTRRQIKFKTTFDRLNGDILKAQIRWQVSMKLVTNLSFLCHYYPRRTSHHQKQIGTLVSKPLQPNGSKSISKFISQYLLVQ